MDCGFGLRIPARHIGKFHLALARCRLSVLVAQWIDAGFRDARFLTSFLDRFSSAFRKQMTVDQYLQLRLADGFCALAMRQSDEAIRASWSL